MWKVNSFVDPWHPRVYHRISYLSMRLEQQELHQEPWLSQTLVQELWQSWDTRSCPAPMPESMWPGVMSSLCSPEGQAKSPADRTTLTSCDQLWPFLMVKKCHTHMETKPWIQGWRNNATPMSSTDFDKATCQTALLVDLNLTLRLIRKLEWMIIKSCSKC